MCVLNEEEHIERALLSLLRIKDIDYIHILDGYWWHPGIEEKIKKDGFNSTDKTCDIVADFGLSQIPVLIRPATKLYLSESEKRNYQLQLIDEQEKDDYWVFVLDGDEILEYSVEPRQDVHLKQYLGQKDEVGMVLSEGYGFSGQRFTARFIRGRHGIHYHTGTTQCIHDSKCRMISDYKNDVMETTKVFPMTQFKLVNYWTMKGRQRIMEKDTLFQVLKNRKIMDCIWESSVSKS